MLINCIREPKSDTSVLFVHGIFSSGDECWKHPNGTKWPELLKEESELEAVGIYVYSYETRITSGTYSLCDIVNDLKERLFTLKVLRGSKKIIFVCHSMGGIVVRKLIVERYRDFIRNGMEIGLYLVASPSLGSDYANWLEPIAIVAGHAQAKALRFSQDNLWLNDLDNTFFNLKDNIDLKIRGKELIEDKFITLSFFMHKQVVPLFSGNRYFPEHYKVTGSDHFSIAKPKNKDAMQHQLLVSFIKDNFVICSEAVKTEKPEEEQKEIMLPNAGVVSSEPKKTELDIDKVDHDFYERFFTNTDNVRQKVGDLIRDNEKEFNIRLLAIHGHAGVGKTIALKMSRLLYRKNSISAVYVDANDPDILSEGPPPEVNILKKWSDWLGKDGIKLDNFLSLYDQYDKLYIQCDQSGRYSDFTYEETRLVKYPTEPLTKNFIKDLKNRTSSGNRIVLMIDTFEKITGLDKWLSGFVSELPDSVMLMLAGRKEPNWHLYWIGYETCCQAIKIEEMANNDLRKLINKVFNKDNKEADSQQIESIINHAQGLPLLAHTLADLVVRGHVKDFKELSYENVADLVNKIFELLPQKELLPGFNAATILRFFNKNSLEAVLAGNENSNIFFDEIKEWPFVYLKDYGYGVHEKIREIINRKIEFEDPNSFRDLHKKAAQYYQSQFKAFYYERDYSEYLYHIIKANEQEGIKIFQDKAEQLDYSLLTYRLKNLLKDANNYDLKLEKSLLWLEYYKIRLKERENYDVGNAYQEIADNPIVEDKLKSYALLDSAWQYIRKDELGQPGVLIRVKKLLQTSLLPKPDARTIHAYSFLYRVYVFERKIDEALNCLNKLKSYYEDHNDQSGKVSTLQKFISCYALIGDWKKAYSVADVAKEILDSLPDDDPVLRHRLQWSPWRYIWSGRFIEAELVIKDAIKFYRDRNDVHTLLVFLYDLSLALGVQGKYEDCLNNFKETIAQLKDIEKQTKHNEKKINAVILGYRGYISILQGNLQQANDDLTEGLTSKQNLHDEIGIPEIYNWLGELNEVKASQLEGDEKINLLKLAQSYYNESLKLNNGFRYYFECGALTGLVRVYYSLGENNIDIGNCILNAEKLSLEYEYNDYMAVLRLYQGHIAFHQTDINSFDNALGYYKESLIYALRFNRFQLDEILSNHSRRKIPLLQAIIPTCLQRGEDGRRMLEELRSWWNKGRNVTSQPQSESISPIREGIALIQAEQQVRDQEEGDLSPQRWVVEQIEKNL